PPTATGRGRSGCGRKAPPSGGSPARAPTRWARAGRATRGGWRTSAGGPGPTRSRSGWWMWRAGRASRSARGWSRPCGRPGPDGEWIAYQEARRRDGDWYSIWKVRPDGSRPTELVLNGAWGAVHPSWSPDGLWIAFGAVGKGPRPAGAVTGPGPTDGDIYL